MARRRSMRVGPWTNIRREEKALTVVVCRRGKRFSEYFPYGVWGGEDLALVAAQRYRDRLLLRIDPDTRVRRKPPKGSRNKTGFLGVSEEAYVVEGRHYKRYVATWRDPDAKTRVRRRRFSILYYGREHARALAAAARAAGIAEVHARQRVRQREEARARLVKTAPMPRQVRDPSAGRGSAWRVGGDVARSEPRRCARGVRVQERRRGRWERRRRGRGARLPWPATAVSAIVAGELVWEGRGARRPPWVVSCTGACGSGGTRPARASAGRPGAGTSRAGADGVRREPPRCASPPPLEVRGGAAAALTQGGSR
jgi:hypothetical protein